MKWQLQTLPGRCESSSCTSKTILPGEAVRLVLNGRQRWCKACAFTRLFELPPARETLPHQAQPKGEKIHVAGGKFVDENFGTFDRVSTGGEVRKNILTRRQLEDANANDPKLRQAGDR